MVVVGWFGSLLAQLLISGPQYRLEFGTDTRGSEILAGCGLAILLHVRPELTDRFRGRPRIDAAKCVDGCRACADACPTQAITINGGKVVQTNYNQFPLIRINKAPDVEVHWNITDNPPTGLGEPALPPAIPAIIHIRASGAGLLATRK